MDSIHNTRSPHHTFSVGFAYEVPTKDDLIDFILKYQHITCRETEVQLFIAVSRYTESLNLDFSQESVRLSTFESNEDQVVWPKDKPSSLSMVKAGLFFLGVLDMVSKTFILVVCTSSLSNKF